MQQEGHFTDVVAGSLEKRHESFPSDPQTCDELRPILFLNRRVSPSSGPISLLHLRCFKEATL
jgi:hypothetical protein